MTGEEVRTGTIVAIGDPAVLAGYVLAGVQLLPARSEQEARAAWEGIGEEVGLALLTPAAAEAVGTVPVDHRAPLTAVIPR